MLRNIFDSESLKKKVEEIKNELEKEKIVAESGGGMVKVRLNGLGEITNLEIEDGLFKGEDKDMTEDLIVAAINKSKEKVKELWQEKLKDFLGFLPLPGINDLIT
ncbi:MAG: YbaB/EbfC family nucleoid-associated protein [candidate division WOR-3 bacterium]|nr:YbaB/EbfC family nucleoid-associated protein [candidate division WOR-3 bacterium]